ncbi:Thioredoxin reductase [hydrothermal vent metagenome]|uniref:Thioredoxin reductase n=1 Tax=hydrothermal vent metagenome TaxID=652676 RepID=A0A3B0RK77_9ZZZZ
MSKPTHIRVAIIGSGAAGYTAAIYAARAMLEPVVFSGLQPGGQLTITSEVENYPGFAEQVQGPWLMDQMREQTLAMGTKIIDDTITKVELGSRPFKLVSDANGEFTADTVIIATGAQARWLGLESEEKYKGFGVSACATCDGFFYRDKQVAVIGGGNTAVEEALFLTKFASKVYLVHRRDELRAEKILQNRLLAHKKIQPIWNHTLEEVLGADNPPGVTGMRIADVQTGKTKDIDLDGVFIAIGHKPSTELFVGQLPFKQGGYLITKPDSTATKIPGVFAAGDVTDDVFRQAVTAAGRGCMAALEAEKFLEN